MRILVINPNSTEAVTRGIDEAVEPLRMAGGPAIDCVTLKEGPPGVETQQHVDGVVPHLLSLVSQKESQYSAFVIACYSDPGLHSVREATKKPVLGISECGILTALTLGQRFGVIAILQRSIPRHLRYVGALGVTDRFAGELPVGIPVVELSMKENLRADGRGRQGAAREARRGRGGDGLRRHGALSQAAAGRDRHPGSGAHPSSRRDGDRTRTPELGWHLAFTGSIRPPVRQARAVVRSPARWRP
jgi:Asp/Glu/hydantoin racemase